MLLPIVLGVEGSASTPDPFAKDQWALKRIGVQQAWLNSRGAGITVAVIDSGVDQSHEDLGGRIHSKATCMDTGGDLTRCTEGNSGDDDGHGTHVAGILAAVEGNGKGVAGVAPDAKIMDIRTLRRVCVPPQVPGTELRGSGSCHLGGAASDVRAAIRWAIARGAQVINLSLADDVVTRTNAGSAIAPEVNEAWRAGVVVVVASGNDLNALMGSGYNDLPVLVVTATGPDDARPSYANSVGEVRWGIAAPGGSSGGSCPTADVLSTYRDVVSGPGYACLAGTSMAAPHVSGVAAMLMAKGWTADGAVNRIISTTQDIGASGKDRTFGYGMINAEAATTGAPPPKPIVSAMSQGEPVSKPEPTPTVASSPAPSPDVSAPVVSSPTPQPQVRGQRLLRDGTGGPLLLWIAAVLLTIASLLWFLMRRKQQHQ